jgi:hypothetical protein
MKKAPAMGQGNLPVEKAQGHEVRVSAKHDQNKKFQDLARPRHRLGQKARPLRLATSSRKK